MSDELSTAIIQLGHSFAAALNLVGIIIAIIALIVVVYYRRTVGRAVWKFLVGLVHGR